MILLGERLTAERTRFRMEARAGRGRHAGEETIALAERLATTPEAEISA
jgi:hypothetical protein